MSKVLVDTNVLVYVKDISSTFHKAAIRLFNGKDELFTTTKNLSEYYAVVTKGEHSLLSPLEALHDINEFVSNCSLLYPNSTSQKILSDWIIKYRPKGLLIHDFEIAAIGIANGINSIATFNTEDFKSITEIEAITF